MNQPIIEYQYMAIIRKVTKTPDARFKSGYRDIGALSENHIVLYPNMAQAFFSKHIHKSKRGMTETTSHGTISIQAIESSLDL